MDNFLGKLMNFVDLDRSELEQTKKYSYTFWNLQLFQIYLHETVWLIIV